MGLDGIGQIEKVDDNSNLASSYDDIGNRTGLDTGTEDMGYTYNGTNTMFLEEIKDDTDSIWDFTL